MKCPNCSSSMFVADKTVEIKSLVTFFRCSTCIGAHVTSELTNHDEHLPSNRLEFFNVDHVQKLKHSYAL